MIRDRIRKIGLIFFDLQVTGVAYSHKSLTHLEHIHMTRTSK